MRFKPAGVPTPGMLYSLRNARRGRLWAFLHAIIPGLATKDGAL